MEHGLNGCKIRAKRQFTVLLSQCKCSLTPQSPGLLSGLMESMRTWARGAEPCNSCVQLVKAAPSSPPWDEAAPGLVCSRLSPVHFSPSENNTGEQEAVSGASRFTRRALFEETPECTSQIEYNGDTK